MRRFKSGSVLIVVLWICFGLVAMTLTFGHSMLTEVRGTDNRVAARQADQAIQGGLEYALLLLANAEVPGKLPRLETYQQRGVPVGEDAKFWFLGRPGRTGQSGEPVFGFVDEASKLNLNTATLEMLEMLPGMTPDLAASILEWRQTDDAGLFGAITSTAYLMGSPSYFAKSAPFETVEELALVLGFDLELLVGWDTNRNGVIDPHEEEFARLLPEGLLEYVTVSTREPNLREDGSARINVNNRSTEFQEFLNNALGAGRVEQVEQALGPGNVRFNSLLEFYVRSGLSPEEFDRIAGELSVGEGDFRVGAVNVNTASEIVLACIPGIGLEYAAVLVAERERRNDPQPGLAWVADILDEESLALAGRHLTHQGWQTTVDIAAVGQHGRGYRRARFVIDHHPGNEEPRVLFRSDQSHLGWALGTSIQEALAEGREAGL